jgi:hypothetical protein
VSLLNEHFYDFQKFQLINYQTFLNQFLNQTYHQKVNYYQQILESFILKYSSTQIFSFIFTFLHYTRI